MFLKRYDIIADAKRLIGRRFSDNLVQSDIRLWPFKVIEGPDDKPLIVVIRVKRSTLLLRKSRLWSLQRCMRLLNPTWAQV